MSVCGWEMHDIAPLKGLKHSACHNVHFFQSFMFVDLIHEIPVNYIMWRYLKNVSFLHGAVINQGINTLQKVYIKLFLPSLCIHLLNSALPLWLHHLSPVFSEISTTAGLSESVIFCKRKQRRKWLQIIFSRTPVALQWTAQLQMGLTPSPIKDL